MAIGAMAQLVGGIAFTPMDIVKERMQVQGMVQGVPGAYVYRGALHAVACIVRDGGALSLFRGYWVSDHGAVQLWQSDAHWKTSKPRSHLQL